MDTIPNDISIRPAVDSDLDSIACIGMAAFPFEPQWPYRYPYAAEFPHDHVAFTKMRYAEWLNSATAGDCIIMVAESPSLEDATITKVIGLSIWRLPQLSQTKSYDKLKPPKANASRRDANPLHVAAYRESIDQAQEEYFDRVYGKAQLSLAQLATHPDYWRRGTGTKLLQWGISMSMQEGWPITVFAGPFAYSLYRKLGFKIAGTVVASVVGEEEEIEFPGMAFEPDSIATPETPILDRRRIIVEYAP